MTPRLLLAHIGGTSDFRYSGYRYGYYPPRRRPRSIRSPTLYQELAGAPPGHTPTIRVIREARQDLGLLARRATRSCQAALGRRPRQKPFAEVMDELVLKPFGMEASTFVQPTPARLRPPAMANALPSRRRAARRRPAASSTPPPRAA